MNYQIIRDEVALKEFIEWLPNLEAGETYYISLLARSKYCSGVKHINSDKQQLKRFLSTKEFLYEKIKQLECEVGSYTQKHAPMPQEALAIYITLNPRSFEKAAKNGLIRLANLITQPYSNYNPQQELMSEVHRACSRKIYLDIDFDNPFLDKGGDCSYMSNEYFLTLMRCEIYNYINDSCLTYLLTRGGFHVLIKLNDIAPDYKKTWYKNITNMNYVDIANTNLIPIPGCTQGNFIPKLIL